jgi:hypothetical protein
MSIDQDHLMRTQEQILIDYDRLRQEGKKHAEASQTVIDRWQNTEGWNGGKIYTLIQNTHRLRAQAAKVKTEPTKTTETTETTEVAEMAATTVEVEETTGQAETTVPTLLELEAKAQKAWQTAQTAGWEWAVAITEIHDSRCYPGSAEAGSWETYMLSRWGIRRAQAFNVVAWVHHEMTLTLVPMLPEELETDGQSTSVDSGTGKQAIPPTTGVSVAGGLPPAKPVHATERESREARTKHRKIRGKLNEDDLDALREAGNVVKIEGGDDYLSRTEADRQNQEGDLVKVDDKNYRPGVGKPAAAKRRRNRPSNPSHRVLVPSRRTSDPRSRRRVASGRRF